MRLRKLEEKDAPLMLEWMHDPSVVEYMQADFASKTIDDCVDFIKSAADRTTGIHFAVVDDNDEYMGTVSLKHITDNDAEFAITVRKAAMGRGFSTFAMKEIIEYGFNTLNLNLIYWCVNPDNKRAVRFYDKNGYKRVMLNSTVQIFGGGTLQNKFRAIFGIGQKKQQEQREKQQEGLQTIKYFQQNLSAQKYREVC